VLSFFLDELRFRLDMICPADGSAAVTPKGSRAGADRVR
jgi:hypothetical protein